MYLYCKTITKPNVTVVLAKNNAKEVEEEVIAECYDDIDDTNENTGSDSQDSDEGNDKPDPKVLDKFKVNDIYIYISILITYFILLLLLVVEVLFVV